MSELNIAEILQERKIKNREKQINRIARLEERSPEFKSLTRERNMLLGDAAVLRLKKNYKAAEEKENQVTALDIREKEILSEMDLPPDYLDEQYSCYLCRDTGYLSNGEICECIKALIQKERYNRYDLTEAFKERNFENFNLNLFSKNIIDDSGMSPYEAILNYLQMGVDYISKFPDDIPSYYIYGGVGVGKTYFVSCIINDLIDKAGVDVIFITAPNIINYLYEDITKHTTHENSYKNEFKTAQLLVIDDLGSENPNQFSLSALTEILDYRITNKKSTIITSNISPRKLFSDGIYPSRLVSRILGNFESLSFIGSDLRFKTI